MCEIGRGKDPIESKTGNKWMAPDPRGDKKEGTKRTGGAGFEQEERHQNVHEHERMCVLGIWKLASVLHYCFSLLMN